jgi:IS5 family transposase
LSFRRFSGLPLEVERPDHASIWRFRQTIERLGLSAVLLAETNRQLDALGLIAKRGTLVDATLIAAAVKKPPYGSGGVNPRDPDARVTMKRKTAHLAITRVWRWTGARETRVLVRHYVRTNMLERKAHALRMWDARVRAIVTGEGAAKVVRLNWTG